MADRRLIKALNSQIGQLEQRIGALEKLFPRREFKTRDVSSSFDESFRMFPPMLRAEHIAYIYGYTINTVRKMAQKYNKKIPTPCVRRPLSWRRSDVRRHYERLWA